MTFDITATIRARNSKPLTPWLPVSMTLDAADLKSARQQYLNHLILAGIEYGTLTIGWDLLPPVASTTSSSLSTTSSSL